MHDSTCFVSRRDKQFPPRREFISLRDLLYFPPGEICLTKRLAVIFPHGENVSNRDLLFPPSAGGIHLTKRLVVIFPNRENISYWDPQFPHSGEICLTERLAVIFPIWENISHWEPQFSPLSGGICLQETHGCSPEEDSSPRDPWLFPRGITDYSHKNNRDNSTEEWSLYLSEIISPYIGAIISHNVSHWQVRNLWCAAIGC